MVKGGDKEVCGSEKGVSDEEEKARQREKSLSRTVCALVSGLRGRAVLKCLNSRDLNYSGAAQPHMPPLALEFENYRLTGIEVLAMGRFERALAPILIVTITEYEKCEKENIEKF